MAAGLSSILAIEGKFNLTPLLHVKVYRDWFHEQRAAILDEIARTYTDTMAAGYLWPPNIIEEVQSGFQKLLKSLDYIAGKANEVFQSVVKNVPDPQEKRTLIDTLLKHQDRYRVSNRTWKLIKPRNEARILLSDKNDTRTAGPLVACPQTGNWQCEMNCPTCGSRIGFNHQERGCLFTCQCGAEVVLW